MQIISSESGSTSKAVFSSSAKRQSGVERVSAAAAPHSSIFAACQATAGLTPLIIGRAVYIAQSLDRPAMIMLALWRSAKT